MDQITRPEDFAIFDAFKAKNSSQVLELIDNNLGTSNGNVIGK